MLFLMVFSLSPDFLAIGLRGRPHLDHVRYLMTDNKKPAVWLVLGRDQCFIPQLPAAVVAADSRAAIAA